jgi:hypothetical protein
MGRPLGLKVAALLAAVLVGFLIRNATASVPSMDPLFYSGGW